jgi:hypothetical protein
MGKQSVVDMKPHLCEKAVAARCGKNLKETIYDEAARLLTRENALAMRGFRCGRRTLVALKVAALAPSQWPHAWICC